MIHFAEKKDLKGIQQFIHQYWQINNILSKNKELMDFQHYNGEGYNFVIGEQNNKIGCLLGFVPTKQYDPAIKRRDIWLCIWIKADWYNSGYKLLNFLEENYKPDSIGAIGINNKIEKLYLTRGWKSGKLKHYYFLNHGNISKYEHNINFSHPFEKIKYFNIPEKSNSYILNRYVNHPFYNYLFREIDNKMFVFRKIHIDNSIILRIIDIFGKHESFNYSFALQYLCSKYEADYIDIVCNADENFILNMGFTEKPSNLILPNWFEPFIQEHHDIKFAYKSEGEYIIFKGDSDQDRPNKL